MDDHVGSWQRSTRCQSNSCVEVGQAGQGDIGLRNSTDPTGPILMFPRDEFAEFIRAVKAGDFDRVAAT